MSNDRNPQRAGAGLAAMTREQAIKLAALIMEEYAALIRGSYTRHDGSWDDDVERQDHDQILAIVARLRDVTP